MKTGIIRHVDDLGRVVIPKDIRRSLMINNGDPLEITVIDDDIITITKHYPEDACDEVIVSIMGFIKTMECDGTRSASIKKALALMKEARMVLMDAPDSEPHT